VRNFLFALMLLPCAAQADRIAQMNRTDLCTYTAKLEVAGYYYFAQGKARDEVKIHWKGDETENEVAFVNRTLDHAYTWLGRWKENSTSMMPAQAFGDMIYQACMEGKPL
jgi:hypothetical protein